MLCFCCAQISMRKKALNHVDPGSDWSNYSCCQGYYGGCCCFKPGEMGEKSCPVPCMCLESCMCPGLAVSATSSVIREKYQLGLDDDDVRLIRCNNCLQMAACLASCLNICIDFEGDDACVAILDLIADVVFCVTSGCMTAQVYHEINLRDKQEAPFAQAMERWIRPLSVQCIVSWNPFIICPITTIELSTWNSLNGSTSCIIIFIK